MLFKFAHKKGKTFITNLRNLSNNSHENRVSGTGMKRDSCGRGFFKCLEFMRRNKEKKSYNDTVVSEAEVTQIKLDTLQLHLPRRIKECLAALRASPPDPETIFTCLRNVVALLRSTETMDQTSSPIIRLLFDLLYTKVGDLDFNLYGDASNFGGKLITNIDEVTSHLEDIMKVINSTQKPNQDKNAPLS
jgi:hypothetical protein